MKTKSLLFLIFISQFVFAQDTLKVMVYNLLQYGFSGGVPVSTKNANLKTIIDATLPDIFGVNEMASNAVYAQNILQNVLNQNGRTYYDKATYSNLGTSNEVNMLFFNSQKVGISKQYNIYHSLRDFNVYKMYYKDANLAATNDTVFFTVCVGHLKASTGFEQDRLFQVQTLTSFLDTLTNPGNLVFMGDFNLYTSTEPAFQHLLTFTNTNVRFYDPINQPGDWNNDATFKPIHTQSTRVNAETDGGAPGGLDDRFDIILINQSLKDSLNKVKYVPGTYKAYGNDANHFNGAVNSGNTSVSGLVANALYAMSDHLPVIAKFVVQKSVGSDIQDFTSSTFKLEAFPNPVTDKLTVDYQIHSNQNAILDLVSIEGKIIKSIQLNSNQNQVILELNNLKSGIYFLNFKINQIQTKSIKVVKI